MAESNINRLGVEDLMEEVMDRMTTGIGGGKEKWTSEEDADWEKAKSYARRLKLIAEKYKIDERGIR